MYVGKLVDVLVVERELKNFLLRRTPVSVMVASEEFYVTIEKLKDIVEYLRSCVERRFIPWVFIKRDR